jgi:hypothetical protein
MVVPAHLLTVTYTFKKDSEKDLFFPRGWTTRKK